MSFLDKMSVQQYLDSLPSPIFPKESKKSVLVWLTQLENLPWDLKKFSALYACVLVYQRLHAPSNTGKLIPQTMRWQGGTGVLIEALKKKLVELGVDIREESPVRHVKHGDDFVEVTVKKDSGDEVIKADYAVFAMSPPAVGKNIEFEPKLPDEYNELNKVMEEWSDPAYNIVLKFPSRFWVKDEGPKYKNYLPSPLGLADPHKGGKFARCFGAVMDLTPADSPNGYLRILVDPIRTQGLELEEVKEAAIDYLKKCYELIKFDENKDKCTLIIENWEIKKPYLDVTYMWPPGGSYLKYFPTLTKPCKRLYWAGAERSLSGVSWMEGAVTSGTVVTKQIADDLGLDYGSFFEEIKEKNAAALAEVRGKVGIFTDEIPTITTIIDIILRSTFDPFHRKLSEKLEHNANASLATAPLMVAGMSTQPPSSVTIKKISGKNLAARDWNGKSDPYLHIGWVKRGATARFVDKNENGFLWQSPVNAESLSFSFPHEGKGVEELQTLPVDHTKLLQIEVWDKDTLSADDWMGCVWIDLAHIGNPEKLEFVLEQGPGGEPVTGTIGLEFEWNFG